METFSASLALCARNSPGTGEFPSQRPVTRSLDVFLVCASTNGWVNNQDAGDLRCHHAHYDVIVMNFGEGQMCIRLSKWKTPIIYMLITVKSHGRHGVSNHRQVLCSTACSGQRQKSYQARRNGPLCKYVHLHHKGPVNRTAFPCRDIIIACGRSSRTQFLSCPRRRLAAPAECWKRHLAGETEQNWVS